MNEPKHMGRPKLDCEVRRISLRLSLHLGRDDDLIEFFNAIPTKQRASMVKAALRSGGMTLAIEKIDAFNDAEETDLLNAFAEMEW